MQNKVERVNENGKSEEVTIFNECTDLSGFVIREMLETKNPEMAWQAGHYVRRPMRIPIYTGAMVTSHRDGDEVQVFHLQGNGRTKEEALTRASNKLLRADVEKHNARQKVAVLWIAGEGPIPSPANANAHPPRTEANDHE